MYLALQHKQPHQKLICDNVDLLLLLNLTVHTPLFKFHISNRSL